MPSDPRRAWTRRNSAHFTKEKTIQGIQNNAKCLVDEPIEDRPAKRPTQSMDLTQFNQCHQGNTNSSHTELKIVSPQHPPIQSAYRHTRPYARTRTHECMAPCGAIPTSSTHECTHQLSSYTEIFLAPGRPSEMTNSWVIDDK